MTTTLRLPDTLDALNATLKDKAAMAAWNAAGRFGELVEHGITLKAEAMQADQADAARAGGRRLDLRNSAGDGAGPSAGGGLPSLMPDSAGLAELQAAISERRGVNITTPPVLNAAITTTQTGRTATALGVTGRGGPIRIAELTGITADRVEWGGSSVFPILGAGTAPGATGEGSLKPEYDAITPGTATPQTLAQWTDLSNQALSLPNLQQKLQNKLARLVALGENNLLRAKVVGTAGVVTQGFVAGDQAVQILRSAAIIEAAMNVRADLMLYNPEDTATIFGSAVSNAAPQEIAELSVRLFGMLSLPMSAQTAGFVTMGAWSAGSRLVVGLAPTFSTDPYSQMKNNLTTVLLEEAVDLAVEEPEAFRIVDIVTP
jgi:hypothetical protein